jgi:hypothetical protein
MRAVAPRLDALIVVVDGDRQDLLRVLLPDDIVVQEVVDLPRLGKLLEGELGGVGQLFGDDVVAELDALVTDVNAGTGDQLLDLFLRLAAETALDQIATVSELRHVGSSSPLVPLHDVVVPRPSGSGPAPVAPVSQGLNPSGWMGDHGSHRSVGPYAAPTASIGRASRAVMTSSIRP